MWRFRLVYLFCLIGTAIFHLIYAGALSWYILLVVLFLPVLSFIFSLPSMLMARLEIHLPPAVSKDEAAQLRVTITNRWITPAALVRFSMRRQNVFNGTTETLPTQYFYAAWQQSVAVPLPTEHCGKLTYTIDKAWATDFLGLFALPVRKRQSASCTVYPTPISPDKVAKAIRNLKQRLVPKLGGGFSEEHEMRPYREGDPIRNIHWKLTSKLDEIIVREPMETEHQRINISIELKGNPAALDNVLGQLLWLSKVLLDKGMAHNIIHPYAPSQRLCVYSVQDVAQLMEYLKVLLQSRAALQTDEPRSVTYSHSGKCFVLQPQKEVRGK